MGLENWGLGKKANSYVRVLLMSLSQVLDLSSTDRSGVVISDSQVEFLDEFRIMIIPCYNDVNVLSVFDTSIPEDHPGKFCQFGLPQKYAGWFVDVHLDRDRSLGIVNRDGPLIVDATQDIFIVDLGQTNDESRVFLILRIRPLIERVCSRRADVQISWDEWGRDAVFMEVPIVQTDSSIAVHGARVLTISMAGEFREDGHMIHTFDFSQKGIAALRLDENGDGTWRRAHWGDGCVFDGNLWYPCSLGDSAVFASVSLLSCPPGENVETDRDR